MNKLMLAYDFINGGGKLREGQKVWACQTVGSVMGHKGDGMKITLICGREIEKGREYVFSDGNDSPRGSLLRKGVTHVRGISFTPKSKWLIEVPVPHIPMGDDLYQLGTFTTHDISISPLVVAPPKITELSNNHPVAGSMAQLVKMYLMKPDHQINAHENYINAMASDVVDIMEGKLVFVKGKFRRAKTRKIVVKSEVLSKAIASDLVDAMSIGGDHLVGVRGCM